MTIFNITGVVGVFPTNAAMTAAGSDLADGGVYLVKGRAAVGDGGEGLWRYSSSTTATANGGTILAIDGGGVGRFLRIFDGALQALWFASGDGSTNDRTAVQDASSAATAMGRVLEFADGTFFLGTEATTLGADILMTGDALFKGGAGATLNLSGKFDGGLRRRFWFADVDDLSNSDAVTLSRTSTDFSRPEWWDGTSRGNCLPSLKAAETCGLAMLLLMPADYFITATWNILTPHLLVKGYLRYGTGGACARIAILNGTSSAIIVGPSSNPGEVNDFQQETRLRDFAVSRSVVPPKLSGSFVGAPTGVLFRYCLYCGVENVSASEHSVGFGFKACVQVSFNDLLFTRGLAGSGTGSDRCAAIHLDGVSDVILAGGNASIYGRRLVLTINDAVVTSDYAIYAEWAFADTFINEIEATSPIYFTGVALSGNAELRKSGNGNVSIAGAVIDAFNSYGMVFEDVSEYGSISVQNSYAAADSTNTTGGAVLLDNFLGSISFGLSRFVIWPSSGAKGIVAVDSRGFVFDETNIILGSTAPVDIDGCSEEWECSPTIKNPTESSTNAVLVADSTDGVIAPQISGGPNVFATGIALTGSGNDRITIEVARVLDSAVSGNLLVINGSAISADGAQ